MVHPSALPLEELLKLCDIRRERRSGPGGQHRNKVETAVVLIHRPSGVKGEASERRSQGENRQVALGRLRVNLALQVRHANPFETAPSARWRSRVHAGRLRVSAEHEDFAALLAEALDVIDDHQGDVSGAAAILQVTSSQLVRLLRTDSRALLLVNSWRLAAGRHALS